MTLPRSLASRIWNGTHVGLGAAVERGPSINDPSKLARFSYEEVADGSPIQ